MKTKLTELLNIQYPIIQGAMAWVSDGKLAGAVSAAGGAGTIAAGGRSAQWLKEQIEVTRSITDKPFGVNIMLMADNCDEIVDVVCEAKVAYATLGAGNPVPYFEKLHNAGVKVIPVIPNVKLAKRVADKGADALIIEGMEAGGHIGKLTTMALMTQVIPEVNIPVVVAGGIAEGRGLAAALVMGAAGVQMGTRFYASEECSAHINAKTRIVEATDTDTVVTGALHGHAVRGIQNQMTNKYLALEKEGVSEGELEKIVVGTSRKAPVEGDVEWGFVQAGQSLTVIKSIETCSQIISSIVEDAKKALSGVQQYI
ncbi:MAG: 2-nitropropane dioxygenase [Anaerosolibacter sp.]|jgi:enoyl-[acyl-carrier protein] reductase II|uniref:nitronate monooxygenase n=1 Tax=Anaerosolibacter sp. TaxID=1872527 RepID=UPI002631EB40|nr:nitronate monooxygenase [Anaerosolibacter sp.]MDF2546029.1 2-nitropropane dioxygenase [Anaerosolibacter sp.]